MISVDVIILFKPISYREKSGRVQGHSLNSISPGCSAADTSWLRVCFFTESLIVVMFVLFCLAFF